MDKILTDLAIIIQMNTLKIQETQTKINFLKKTKLNSTHALEAEKRDLQHILIGLQVSMGIIESRKKEATFN